MPNTIELSVPSVVSFTEYSTFFKNSYFVISSGWQPADNLLNGGVHAGEVTELFGSSSSGKTQFAMTLALNAVYSGYSVIVIDSLCSWNAMSLSRCFCNLFPQFDIDSTQFRRCMAGLRLLRPSINDVNINMGLAGWLYKILAAYSAEDVAAVPHLFIIDSISSILLPLVTAKSPLAMFQFSKIISMMDNILAMNKAVVAINSKVSSRDSSESPSLGSFWQPKMRVLFKRLSDGSLSLSMYSCPPFRCISLDPVIGVL
ncbi:hypothetical protein GEMRC1_000116 [Eukaryota sp. GEM-RC1]